MKKMNIVRNTITEGTETYREKSRIGSINHRIWSVFAPMLFIAFGLFGVNVKAWATWPSYSGTITKEGSTYYVVYDNTEYSLDASGTGQSHTYQMGGPGNKLSMYARRTRPTAVGELEVKSYNNDEEKDIVYHGNPEGTKYSVIKGYQGYGNLITETLTTKAVNKLIFSASWGSYVKQFKEVKVTMFTGVLQPSITSGSWTYSAANYAAQDSYKDFTVDWSNLSSLPISIVKNVNSDDLSQFSYTIRSNTQTLEGGKYGTATIRIFYKHDKVGTHSVKVKVGDYYIKFTGTTNKITPYIVTTPTVDTITYGQTIRNSQLGTGLVKADLINAAGTEVLGTWTIDENDQTVSTSGGQSMTVKLTFTPSDQNTYNVLHTTQTMFVRSASMITWASAYSATKPTIPVGKTIENAATTTAAGATITYSTSNPDVIVIENEGTTFRAIAEGEATITASHGVTQTHGAASAEKTFKTTYKDIQVIVWNDRFDRLTTEMTSKNLLAQVWIENPVSGERTYSAARTALLEYSVEDNTVVSIPENSTTLTIHKKGNTTLTASVEGNDQYESASVTMVVKVREPSAGCDDPLLLDIKNNGTDDYLYRLFSDEIKKPELHTDEYAINVAQGQVPDKLSFAHKGEEYKVIGISFWTYYSGAIKAQQKVNGNWIDVPNSSVTPEKSKWNTIEGLQLDEKATHIRFVRPQGGEGYHYVRNVEVTMKHFIRTETPTVDFGNTIKVNSSEYKDVVVKYSNAKGSLQVTNPFTSDVTVSDEIIDIEECGAFGSATLRIYFNPTTATSIENNIEVKDPIVGNSSALSIHVTADVQRADQTITWNPETNISTIDQILLNGITNGQEYGQMNVIGYEVTNNDGVISVTNNVVTILKPGTVTITATQKGSANYEAADPVEKNFTISAETLTIMESPVAGDITYGQTLSASTLTGGSVQDSKGNTVAGSFSWQAASTQPNAGSAQNFIVVFTPDENAAWYNTLTTSVAVNVAAATPVATPSAANIVYGQKVNASVLSNVGTDGTWAWNTENNEAVLDAGTHEGLAVHFTPSSGNYTELDATVTLTVEKATPVVTAQATAITYGQAISASELSTATGSISGTWAWAVDKTQVLSVGDHVLKANFTSANANYNDLSNVDVTLTVNKIEKLEVPVAMSFCAGESVNFHGNTYSEAGEYQVEAEGATRDTVYNVTVTKLQPTTGTDSKTITVGAAESWNGEDLSGYAVGPHSVEVVLTNAAGCDSTVTLSLTVVPATNTFTNTKGDGNWDDPENWESGIPSGNDPDVIIKGDLIIDSVVTVGNLTIEKNSHVVLTVNGDLTVNGTSESREEYGNLYVENGGEVEVNGGLRVGDLTVEASIGTANGTAQSGQVDKAENIVYANAYIEINMDPSGVVDDQKWYGFTVPFEVNAHNGISRKVGNSYQNCNYGTDYIIAEYDAAKRLSSGKGWKYLSGNTLNAGQFYYFGGDGGYNTYRFKASGNIYTPVAEKTLSMNGTGADANWNAVGNSTLQHAKVSFNGGNYVQVYQNGLDAYKTVATSEATFVVGCPFFIQASENATLALSVPTDASEKYYAPRRSNATQEGVARVNLTSVDGGYSDQIYVSGTEKENDEYVLGHDLSKAGLGTAIPQLWVDAYGLKLSVHEAAWQGENTMCPLGIYAPKEGEYIITATQPENGTQVYLTIDGMPVWNISETDYVLSLEKGTMNNYGLMLIQASRVPTDVENVETADGEKTQKIILNDHLYILRDSRMYDVTGKKVK